MLLQARKTPLVTNSSVDQLPQLLSHKTSLQLKQAGVLVRLNRTTAHELTHTVQYRTALSTHKMRYVRATQWQRLTPIQRERFLDALFASTDLNTSYLFFDEADALFGKRTEVKDAHDRFANVETSHLLERIERHGGIVFANIIQQFEEEKPAIKYKQFYRV